MKSYLNLKCLTTVIVCLLGVLAAVPAAAAPAAGLKLSFIPKPWEMNSERDYMFLKDGWTFFKDAPLKMKSFEALAADFPDPKRYVLRDGSVRSIGAACEKPYDAACDDSSWVTVSVPFNWYDLGEEMDGFAGSVWYRKKFLLPEASLKKGRAVLHFGGVFYRAWVYVNGEKAGFHEGGYTPFEVDVTGLVKPGENLLAVRVSNALDDGDFVIGDWWNYGGIHREVYLEFTDDTYIKDLTVKTELSGDMGEARVEFTAELEGAEATTITFDVYRMTGAGETFVTNLYYMVKGKKTVKGVWKAKSPALWSPEAPNLYFVKATLARGRELDVAGAVFGLRKFEVRGKELFLNGRKVFFRGVNRHDEKFHGEFPDAGRVMTEEERIADFKLIKEMGANAMRTAHYPNHEANYYIADRLGILTIEEGGPTGGPLNDDAYIEKVKQQMTEMYRRDKNHPSIVMWSIGNEFGGDEYLKFIKAAAEHIRSLDGRPITFTETANRNVKEGYNYVDVLSRNEYVGWYGAGIRPAETPDFLKKHIGVGVNMLLQQYRGEYPDKPIFIMEVGAESVCGRHADNPGAKLTRGDEEYQEFVLSRQFRELLDDKSVAGVFPWIFADFKTKSSGGTCQFTPHFNRKGLVCADRAKKRAFELVRNIYGKLARGEE